MGRPLHHDPRYDVELVNPRRREFVTADGRTHRLTVFIDADGDETDDPDEAVAVVGPVGNKWLTIDLRYFDPPTLH